MRSAGGEHGGRGRVRGGDREGGGSLAGGTAISRRDGWTTGTIAK